MAYDNAQSDSNYYSLDESLMKFPILFVFVQVMYICIMICNDVYETLNPLRREQFTRVRCMDWP